MGYHSHLSSASMPSQHEYLQVNISTLSLQLRKKFFIAILFCYASIFYLYRLNFNHNKPDLSFEPPAPYSKRVTSNNSTIQWIDTTGIDEVILLGNSSTCSDIIYTCDGRLPNYSTTSQDRSIVDSSWDAMVELSRVPIFNQTCFAFFHLSNSHFTTDGKTGIHMVWGRIPSTALVIELFPQAQYMLYLDTDAILMSADYTPTSMYAKLTSHLSSRQSYSLIVNKPTLGWLCDQCIDFNLNDGCFNSGALLWKRGKDTLQVLRRWWESRLHGKDLNFFIHKGNNTLGFQGWANTPFTIDHADKMSEQNRLMYLYSKDAEVNKAILPMPRQRNRPQNTSSCPGRIWNHMPCLQDTAAGQYGGIWGKAGPMCFISHFADNKWRIHDTLESMQSQLGQWVIKERTVVPSRIKF